MLKVPTSNYTNVNKIPEKNKMGAGDETLCNMIGLQRHESVLKIVELAVSRAYGFVFLNNRSLFINTGKVFFPSSCQFKKLRGLAIRLGQGGSIVALPKKNCGGSHGLISHSLAYQYLMSELAYVQLVDFPQQKDPQETRNISKCKPTHRISVRIQG